mmetsp:Transcript_93429/g.250643  ORF Transcript_93429/g.250643 Transcript_93429/m.250643 type:complete len:229 (+) Transcript_93429:333-1019(+)
MFCKLLHAHRARDPPASVLVHLVLGEASLSEQPCHGPLQLLTVLPKLRPRPRLDKAVRATHQHHDLPFGAGHRLLCELTGAASGVARPIVWRLRQAVDDREAGRRCGKCVEGRAHEDVLLAPVDKQKAELSLVVRVIKARSDDLNEGRKPSTSSNHAYGSPPPCELTTAVNFTRLFDRHSGDISFLQVAQEMSKPSTLLVRVGLYKEVKITSGGLGASRRVRLCFPLL